MLCCYEATAVRLLSETCCMSGLTFRVCVWCRVDTCVKRFKGAVHVGMSSPLVCAADYNLALQLIKAHWQHVLDCSTALTNSSSAKF